MNISPEFYKGERVSEEELEEMMKEADSINLFGKKAVGVAIKKGFLTEKSIIKVCGIEHAVILKV